MNRPIRIARLLPVLDFGGVETTVIEQVREMDRSGIEFRVCTFWKPGAAAEKIQNAGVAVDCLGVDPAVRNPRATTRLFQYLASHRVDVLHCSITEANFHGALVGALMPNIRTIVEEVGDPSLRSWRGHALVGFSMHLADHCIGVSKPSADYISDDLHVCSHKVSHIDNGLTPLEVLPEGVRHDVRDELGIPRDAIVIGSLGRLDNEVKRFTDLVDAVGRLNEDGRKAICLLVGDGRDRAEIDAYVRERNLTDRVIMTGYRSDTERMYAAMDVFALLSAHEAFGLVVAEAMFCELPVVVTDVGGMSGIVVEGQTGFKVPPFSPGEAARRLEKLIGSRELRNSMGQAGRDRALSRYDASRYVRELRELYFKLVASSG